MPLSSAKKANIKDLAECYVGAFIKCNCPVSKFYVSGEACDSVAEATKIAMEKCDRISVPSADMREHDELLQVSLSEAIAKLDCK
jgi:hypothetical protein